MMGRLAAAALLLASLATPAEAQVYPARPITIVVPFAPGGAADIVARLLAERMTAILQQQVTVENRAGRGGQLGSEAVARAQPDGYTLLYATNATMVTGPIFMRTPGYDPLRSFAPVSLVSFMKAVLAVNPAVPAQTLAELTALLKANPGRYRYAHAGAGTHSFLTAELFKTQTGLDIRDVAAKGPAAAVETVARGDADIYMDVAVGLFKAMDEGRVRPIAVMALARVPNRPQIPTTVEQGMPELLSYTWTGVLAPHGTPPAIIEVLNRAVGSVLSEMEAQATFVRYGMQAEHSAPEEFQRIIAGDLARWSRALPLSATQ